ncbi:MAG TPA: archease [Anaerolineae bacterium]|nr:archease [Anaerolineae bacterium]
MPSLRFEEVEHTADLALKVHGHSLEEIFANAAYGLFSLMADLENLSPNISREVHLEAPDRESLLVDWLNELLYLHEVEEEIYIRFEIETLSSTTLSATVWGINKKSSKVTVKAATFHNLEIKETEDGYLATVVFDV